VTVTLTEYVHCAVDDVSNEPVKHFSNFRRLNKSALL